MRELLYKALHHPNRFVRETGHFTMCTVCAALRGPQLLALAEEVAPRLADGMSDNWSQARFLWHLFRMCPNRLQPHWLCVHACVSAVFDSWTSLSHHCLALHAAGGADIPRLVV